MRTFDFEFDIAATVVKLLNTKPHQRGYRWTLDHLSELRFWVDSWLSSGQNTLKMSEQISATRAKALFGVGACFYLPSNSPMLGVEVQSTDLRRGHDSSPEHTALALFRQLTLSQDCWRVWGTCTTCGRYFLRESKRESRKYCKQSCNTSAQNCTRQKNAETHQKKLQIAQNAVVEYQRLTKAKRAKRSWEDFALARLEKSGFAVKSKSLTRWINDERREAGTGLLVSAELQQREGRRK